MNLYRQISVTIVYTELHIECEIYVGTLLDKYDCHTAYVSHMTNILNWYIDLIIL